MCYSFFNDPFTKVFFLCKSEKREEDREMERERGWGG